MLRLAVVFPFSRDGVPDEERQRRYDRIVATVAPETRISFYHVEGANVFSAQRTEHHLSLVAEAAARQIERAASEGADVVLMYGGIEPGVAAARQRVSIPVVGTAQSVLAVAAQLGVRLGLVVYESARIEDNWALARRHRADQLVVGIRAIEMKSSDLYEQRDEVRRRVVDAARELVEQDGATAICPIGLSLVPSSMSAEELSSQIGLPVLDGERIAVQTADLIGGLGLARRRVVTALA